MIWIIAGVAVATIAGFAAGYWHGRQNEVEPLVAPPNESRSYHGKFPHCDDLVLHPPRFCRFCDMFPDAQMQRLADGVNFTGEHLPYLKTCPSELRRPLAIIEKWPENIPRKR